MSFYFIATLIILSFAFRLLLIIAGPVVKLLLTVFFSPLTRGRFDRSSSWAALTGPVLLAILYGGFIASVTLDYALSAAQSEKNLYLICGAVAALFSLVSFSSGLLAKASGGFMGENPEERVYRKAALISLLSGLAGFFVLIFYPHLIMYLKGTDIFFNWADRLAGFLSGYKVVRIILVVAICGYFLYATVSMLTSLAVFLYIKLKETGAIVIRRLTTKGFNDIEH